MADEEKKDSENPEEQKEESGSGGLPPLSDFDSQADSDGGLPPLGGFDSDGGEVGGLPPISDLQVEEPSPSGGNVRPAPPGYESANAAFSSGGDEAVDTPASGDFQNFAADSDFSPETPEIGPGPDSDVNTPMFDSAFGGDQGFDAAVDTPAPTQAMETPMFGGEESPADGGFDAGAFGGGGGGGQTNAGATPPPDFTPDTGMQDFGMAAGAGGGMAAAPPPSRGGGVGVLALLIILILGVVAGLAGGPYVANMTGIYPEPLNPTAVALDEAQQTVSDRDRRINSLLAELEEWRKTTPVQGGLDITPEQRDELAREIARLNTELTEVQDQFQAKQQDLTRVLSELDQANEEFVRTTENYEALVNQLALTQARRDGLQSEVTRLTNAVGGLEVAEERRIATKKALEHAVDRLVVQVKEGMPLTPEKYSHADRLSAVEDLQSKIASAKWVTPALQEAYTDIYLKELAIANSTEYFFAKVRVTDRFGSPATKWAECVMNGNWGVKYRTLDGKNVGTYENLAAMGAPRWGFKEDYPAKAQEEIGQFVVAARPEGWESQIQFLIQQEEAAKEGTPLQRTFSSL